MAGYIRGRAHGSNAAGLIALLLALLVGAQAAAPLNTPWHGPDAHSSLPHRAPGPGVASDKAPAPDEAALPTSADKAAEFSPEAARVPRGVQAAPPKPPPR